MLISKISPVKDQRGVAALLIVLVIAAAVLIMSYNISMLGIGESELGFVSQKGDEALSIAESCSDEVLRRLRINNDYGVGLGDFQLPVGSNYCIINIVKNASQRVISITGKADNYHRKLVITAEISGTNNDIVSLTNYQEQ